MKRHDELARRVSDCVIALLQSQPFFATLALHLAIRLDPTRKTLAADGRTLRYNPEWIARTGADAIKTAIARVVFACALKHHTRREGRDREKWQTASQLVTHHLLAEAGFAFPDNTTVSQDWGQLSVEEAYARLPDPEGNGEPGDNADEPPAPQEHGAQPPPADPASSPDPQGNTEPGDNADKPPAPQEHGAQPPPTDPASGPDSANEDTQPNHPPPSHDPAGTGEIMDLEAAFDDGFDPFDRNSEEQIWDEALHQARTLAENHGNLPGRLAEEIDAAHRSRLDPREMLRDYLHDTTRADYSWSRPNRRFIDTGLYLPSLHSHGLKTFGIIIDSSGSQHTESLEEAWAVVHDIATEMEPETIHVLQVDRHLQSAETYHFTEIPETIILKGRGGTDFRPGFAWFEEQGIEPTVCLYLTDMLCTDYPENEPNYPTVWINFGPAPPEERYREPWGERIDIDT